VYSSNSVDRPRCDKHCRRPVRSRLHRWSQSTACRGKIFQVHSCTCKMGHMSQTTPISWMIFHLFGKSCYISLYTKFDSSSFSHSWDMDAAQKISNRSRDVTTPLSETICCPSAGTSYDQPAHQIWSLYVNSLRRYKKRRKMQKLGRLWLGIT